MREKPVIIPEYKSAVGTIIEEFVKEKMTCGYRYATTMQSLRRLDQFLRNKGLKNCSLPRELVTEWIAKRKNESGMTHRCRFYLTRRFAEFMGNRGFDVYLPDVTGLSISRKDFTPYIFSREELRRIFREADKMTPSPFSPFRQIIMSALFRLLYGCGLRISEALKLTLADADLEECVLTIRKTKFQKDRLVPMTPELAGRLKQMQNQIGNRVPEAYFFPAPDQGQWNQNSIGAIFRGILSRSGISHGGRGKGPRIHDLRHSYACHRLAQWYREGVDLNAMLPILATYMGHVDLRYTQQYLHLTPELAEELTLRLDQKYGHIIPRRMDQ